MKRRPLRPTLFPYTTLFRSVRPGKVAIVTIKSFRKNLHSKENARDRRGEKFPGHLRIFDIGRFALRAARSEEHTSELQSRFDLVCRLLLEKKKYKYK